MLILSLITLVAALLLVVLAQKLSRSLWQSQVRLARLEQHLADLQVSLEPPREAQADRLEKQEMIEKTVETGAASAETIHKAVADVTFGILGSIPVTRGVAGLVRGVHDGIADTVYSTVRDTNKQIGVITKDHLKHEQRKAGTREPSDDAVPTRAAPDASASGTGLGSADSADESDKA